MDDVTASTNEFDVPGEAVPVAGSPRIPGPMPPWRLYVLAVVSFCLYLPFWVFRTARQYGIGVRYRSTPVWWALGTVAAPVASGVLYEFNRRALALAGRRGRAAGPALSYFGLIVLWALTPLSHYVLAFLLLAPLPVVFVQRNINRAASTTPAIAHPRRSFGVAHWLTAVAGIPALAVTVWLADLPALRTDVASRVAMGERVAGRSGLYELRIPGRGWRQVDSGTIGDPDSDLELVGPGEQTWAVAYANPLAETDLETTVTERRSMIFEDGSPVSYDENRCFLAGGEFIPVSLAKYQVSFGVMSNHYVVITAELEEHVVEIVSHTTEPGAHGQSLLDLLRSFSRMVETKDS